MNDPGNVNGRLLAKMNQRDALRKLESAYREYPSTFYSPEIKRLFLRFFDITTLNVHYIEVIERLREGGNDLAEKCEAHLESEIQRLLQEVNEGLDGADALMQANGLTKEAQFLAESLTFKARVTSPIMRNYLRLMEKIDQLIRMLETLRIDGVVTTRHCESRRQVLKMYIKRFAGSARRLAQELRARDTQSMSSAVKAKRAVLKARQQVVAESGGQSASATDTPASLRSALDSNYATGPTVEAPVKPSSKANGSKPTFTPVQL